MPMAPSWKKRITRMISTDISSATCECWQADTASSSIHTCEDFQAGSAMPKVTSSNFHRPFASRGATADPVELLN